MRTIEHLSFAEGPKDSALLDITLGKALLEQIKRTPDAIAVISDHENITKSFAEFGQDVDRLTRGLRFELGLKHGDHVALWTFNCYAHIVVQYACAHIGAICWLFDPNWTSRELEVGLSMAEHKILFCPGSDSAQQGDKFQFLVTFNGMSEKRKAAISIVCLDSSDVKRYECKSTMTIMSELMSRSTNYEHESQVHAMPVATDPFLVLLTSGSTGTPKAVVHSHFNLVNVTTLVHKRVDYSTGSIVCAPVPAFHGFLAVNNVPALATKGITLVLVSHRYSSSRLVEVMRRHHCTHMVAMPTMVMDALSLIKAGDVQLPSWRGLLYSGAPLGVELLADLRMLVPSVKDIYSAYGATEVTVATHSHPGQEDPSGPPLDHVQIKVVDPETGRPLPLDTPGLAKFRTPFRMIGYFGDESKTKEVFDEDDWYDSGDICRMDAEGVLHFICRTKEVISRGAQKFYPVEVEVALLAHKDIKVAVVLGVPDKRLGQQVGAWVQVHEGSKLTALDIQSFLKDKLSKYKIPQQLVVTKNNAPLTGSGKLSRLLLLRFFECQFKVMSTQLIVN